jgi:putative ABC transport system ATP-binding protein
MSGGEQQRVAIARALINKPLIILADEPTGNLDTASSRTIMSLLLEQSKKGITVVVVTHEEDIAAFTQRTIYLRDGKIVEEKKR